MKGCGDEALDLLDYAGACCGGIVVRDCPARRGTRDDLAAEAGNANCSRCSRRLRRRANVAAPVKDVASLVAYSHSLPDGLSWGSPGPGTRSYIIGELFREVTKARIVHIPYKGAGQAATDLLGNHIPIAFLTINSARSLIDDGRVRALAVSSKSRLAHYPSVPTFADLGFPILTGSSWFGISGPPGMSALLANKINTDVNHAVASTAVTKFFTDADFESVAMSPSEFTKFFLAEISLLEPFIKATSRPFPHNSKWTRIE